MNKESVIDQIMVAFDKRLRPKDSELMSSHRHPEAKDYLQILRGERWQDIRSSDLVGPIPSFLSDQGWRYFLPAFIICFLRDSK